MAETNQVRKIGCVIDAVSGRRRRDRQPVSSWPPSTTIDVLVVNEGELAALAADEAALARGLGVTVVATRGAQGAVAVLPDETRCAAPALPITPVDTTGAGDTFTGVLAAALDAGLALSPALRRASVAAGLACLSPGAQPGMPDRARNDATMRDLPR